MMAGGVRCALWSRVRLSVVRGSFAVVLSHRLLLVRLLLQVVGAGVMVLRLMGLLMVRA